VRVKEIFATDFLAGKRPPPRIEHNLSMSDQSLANKDTLSVNEREMLTVADNPARRALLLIAAKNGSEAQLAQLLAIGGATFDTAVIDIAAQNGHKDCVVALFDALDAQEKIPLYLRWRTLDTAIAHRHLHAVSAFCAMYRETETHCIWMALHRACETADEQLVAVLLKHNGDGAKDTLLVNKVYRDSQRCLLSTAASAGNSQVVEMLIDAGARINGFARDVPLRDACLAGRVSVVKTLLAHGARVDIGQDEYDNNLLNNAMDCGSSLYFVSNVPIDQRADIIMELCKAGAKTPRSLTLWAVRNNAQTLLDQYLLPHKIDLDKVVCGSSPLTHAAYFGDLVCIDKLLRAGAQIDTVAEIGGCTPALHVAAENNQCDSIGALCDAGANVDLYDAHKHTPLSTAADKGNVRAIKLLLAKGAHIDFPVQRVQNTALVCAVMRGHCDATETLLDAGADTSVTSKNSGRGIVHYAVAHCKLLALFRRRGLLTETSVNVKSHRGVTPLMMAVHQLSLKSIALLVTSGARLDAVDCEEREASDYIDRGLAKRMWRDRKKANIYAVIDDRKTLLSVDDVDDFYYASEDTLPFEEMRFEYHDTATKTVNTRALKKRIIHMLL